MLQHHNQIIQLEQRQHLTHQETKIPLILATTSHLPISESDSRIGAVALLEEGVIIIWPDNIAITHAQTNELTGTTQSLESHSRDNLNHEGIHALLGKLFTSARITNPSILLPNKINFKVGEKPKLIENQRPVDYQELAAIGAELAHTDSKAKFLRYLREPNKPTYALALTLLRIITIEYIPDSPDKERMMQDRLTVGKTIDVATLFKICQSDDFALEKIHRIGEIMYGIAHNAFEEADKTK